MPRDNLFKEVTLYVYCTLPIYSACEFRSARITEMCLLQIFRKSEALIHFALLKELYIETKTATRKDPQMTLRSLFFIQNLQRNLSPFAIPNLYTFALPAECMPSTLVIPSPKNLPKSQRTRPGIRLNFAINTQAFYSKNPTDYITRLCLFL